MEKEVPLEDRISFCLCHILRTRKTNLTFRDKRDFLEYYHGTK